jgi:hypothetical protein
LHALIIGPASAACHAAPQVSVFLLLYQHLYFCTSKASKLSSLFAQPPPPVTQTSGVSISCNIAATELNRPSAQPPPPLLRCQYMYFCTSKASKLITPCPPISRQYLYFTAVVLLIIRPASSFDGLLQLCCSSVAALLQLC